MLQRSGIVRYFTKLCQWYSYPFLKPFRVGDNILIQGQKGTVNEIRIFYTIITTYDNRMVLVPNSKLSNEVIVNLGSSGHRRRDIEIKFGNAIDH